MPPTFGVPMREKETVPQWALDHIRQRLKSGEEVINAVALKQGLLADFVLLNTSKGAAIVVKPLVGEARSALLTYPRDLVTFRCADCAGRNVLVDVAPPADVHCTHCGGPHRVEAPGLIRGAVSPEGGGDAKKATRRTTRGKASKRPSKAPNPTKSSKSRQAAKSDKPSPSKRERPAKTRPKTSKSKKG